MGSVPLAALKYGTVGTAVFVAVVLVVLAIRVYRGEIRRRK